MSSASQPRRHWKAATTILQGAGGVRRSRGRRRTAWAPDLCARSTLRCPLSLWGFHRAGKTEKRVRNVKPCALAASAASSWPAVGQSQWVRRQKLRRDVTSQDAPSSSARGSVATPSAGGAYGSGGLKSNPRRLTQRSGTRRFRCRGRGRGASRSSLDAAGHLAAASRRALAALTVAIPAQPVALGSEISLIVQLIVQLTDRISENCKETGANKRSAHPARRTKNGRS
jgi:hypothetical protein